jgi:hypothetical protein
MEANSPAQPKLVDVYGLRAEWPTVNPPAISTLRRWTRERRIPYIQQGRFVYYSIAAVDEHLRKRRYMPAR